MATTKVDVKLIDASSIGDAKYLKGDGTWAAIAAGGGFAGTQVYTGDATWTKATREAALGVDITKVIVEVQGGGGGGGKSSGSNYRLYVGGSGGGYAKKFINVSSVTASVITVGAAGVGATTDAAGSDGGDSSWNDTDPAHGGSSTVTGVKGVGAYGSYGISTGGLGSGGDIEIQGGSGGNGQYSIAGNSMFGPGGTNGYNSTEPAPTAGVGYGSGGGGNYIGNGADGSGGIVIVWEYQ